jgi:hypothetical protein
MELPPPHPVSNMAKAASIKAEIRSIVFLLVRCTNIPLSKSRAAVPHKAVREVAATAMFVS